jgi:hypothetical protein
VFYGLSGFSPLSEVVGFEVPDELERSLSPSTFPDPPPPDPFGPGARFGRRAGTLCCTVCLTRRPDCDSSEPIPPSKRCASVSSAAGCSGGPLEHFFYLPMQMRMRIPSSESWISIWGAESAEDVGTEDQRPSHISLSCLDEGSSFAELTKRTSKFLNITKSFFRELAAILKRKAL